MMNNLCAFLCISIYTGFSYHLYSELLFEDRFLAPVPLGETSSDINMNLGDRQIGKAVTSPMKWISPKAQEAWRVQLGNFAYSDFTHSLDLYATNGVSTKVSLDNTFEDLKEYTVEFVLRLIDINKARNLQISWGLKESFYIGHEGISLEFLPDNILKCSILGNEVFNGQYQSEKGVVKIRFESKASEAPYYSLHLGGREIPLTFATPPSETIAFRRCNFIFSTPSTEICGVRLHLFRLTTIP